MDFVRAATVGRHCDRFRITRQQHDPVGLDERTEDESAFSLRLAIAATAAMYEHRPRSEPIAHRRTGASTF
jgi:hypothetical protein